MRSAVSLLKFLRVSDLRAECLVRPARDCPLIRPALLTTRLLKAFAKLLLRWSQARRRFLCGSNVAVSLSPQPPPPLVGEGAIHFIIPNGNQRTKHPTTEKETNQRSAVSNQQ